MFFEILSRGIVGDTWIRGGLKNCPGVFFPHIITYGIGVKKNLEIVSAGNNTTKYYVL